MPPEKSHVRLCLLLLFISFLFIPAHAQVDNSTAPVIINIQPASGEQGADVVLVILGDNFADWIKLSFAPQDGINITSVKFASARELWVSIRIDKNASPVPRNVTVTDPETGQNATLPGGFRVIAQESPTVTPLQTPAPAETIAATTPVPTAKETEQVSITSKTTAAVSTAAKTAPASPEDGFWKRLWAAIVAIILAVLKKGFELLFGLSWMASIIIWALLLLLLWVIWHMFPGAIRWYWDHPFWATLVALLLMILALIVLAVVGPETALGLAILAFLMFLLLLLFALILLLTALFRALYELWRLIAGWLCPWVKVCKDWVQETEWMCDEWGRIGRKECAEWGTTYRQECTRQQWGCTQYARQTRQECADWHWALRWLCLSYTYVVELVCVAWGWVCTDFITIAETVCKAWYWIWEILCKVGHWIIKWVCRAWGWVLQC